MRKRVEYQIMSEAQKKVGPTTYKIRIKGRLGESWAEWFAPMTITYSAEGDTILTGELPDQAALQGILVNLGNLNLNLISVNPTKPEEIRRTRDDDCDDDPDSD